MEQKPKKLTGQSLVNASLKYNEDRNDKFFKQKEEEKQRIKKLREEAEKKAELERKLKEEQRKREEELKQKQQKLEKQQKELEIKRQKEEEARKKEILQKELARLEEKRKKAEEKAKKDSLENAKKLVLDSIERVKQKNTTDVNVVKNKQLTTTETSNNKLNVNINKNLLGFNAIADQLDAENEKRSNIYKLNPVILDLKKRKIDVPYLDTDNGSLMNNVKPYIDEVIRLEYGEQIKMHDQELQKLLLEDRKYIDDKDTYSPSNSFGSPNYDSNLGNKAKSYDAAWQATVGLLIKNRRNELTAMFDPKQRFAYDLQNKYANRIKDAKNIYENKVDHLEYLNNTGNKYSDKNIYSARSVLDFAKKANDKANYFNTIIDYLTHIGLPEKYEDVPTYVKNAISNFGIKNDLYDKNGKLIFDYNNEYGWVANKDFAKKIMFDQNGKSRLQKSPSVDVKVSEEALENHKHQLERLKEVIQTAYSPTKDDKYFYLLHEKEKNKELNKIYAAVDKIENAQRYILMEKNIKNTSDNFFGNLHKTGYAIQKTARDIVSNPLGIIELEDSFALDSVVDKNRNKMSYTDKLLIDALGYEENVKLEHGSFEDNPWYMAGSVATQSLEFMAEMYAMGGALKYISAANKGTKAAKVADFLLGANYESKAATIADRTAIQFENQQFKRFFARQYLKTLPRLERMSGEAMLSLLLSNTLQLPTVITDVKNDTRGNVDYNINLDGSITAIGFKNQKDFTESLLTSEISHFNENFSEMMGEWGLQKIISKPTSYLWKMSANPRNFVLAKILSTRLGRYGNDILFNAYNNGVAKFLSSSFAKATNRYGIKPIKQLYGGVHKFAKQAHWSGVGGEIAEEYYGNAMGHAADNLASVVGINTRVSEGTVKEKSSDGIEYERKATWFEENNPFSELGLKTFVNIAGGIALSLVFLGLPSAFSYYRSSRKLNKATQNALSKLGEDFKLIQDILTSVHTSSLDRVYTAICSGILDADKREAVSQYYKALIEYRQGLQLAIYDKEDDEGVGKNDQSLHDKALLQSRNNGYSIYSNIRFNDLLRAVAQIGGTLAPMIGTNIENLDDYLYGSERSFNNISSHLIQSGASEDLMNTLYAYNNAREEMNAALYMNEQELHDTINNNHKFINRISNYDGTVKEAKSKNIGRVYIKTEFGKDKYVVADQHGNIKIIDKTDIEDGSIVTRTKEQVIRESDIQTYKDFVDNFATEDTKNRVANSNGKPVRITDNKFGVIHSVGQDGRVLYSINENGQETLNLSEQGETADTLNTKWMRENTLFEEQKRKDAAAGQSTTVQENFNENAQVVESSELGDYIRELQTRQKEDLGNGELSKTFDFIGINNKSFTISKEIAVGLAKLSKTMTTTQLLETMIKSGIVPKAELWPRFIRLIRAYVNDKITDNELAYLLNRKSTKLSKLEKDWLDHLTIDRNGDVEYHGNIVNNFINTTDEEEQSENPLENIPEVSDEDKQKNPLSPILQRLHDRIFGSVAGAIQAHIDDASSSSSITLNKIRSYILSSQDKVRTEYTTGYNYFFGPDDDLHMMVRTHGAIDNNWKNPSNERLIKFKYKSLIEAFEAGGIEAFVAKMNEFVTNHNNTLYTKRLMNPLKIYRDLKLEPYLKYIECLKNKGGITRDLILDLAEAIAHETIIKEDSASVIAGSIMDELNRLFYGKHDVSYDMELTVNGETKKINKYITEEAFNQWLTQSKERRHLYENVLGWKLITDRMIITARVFDKGRNRYIDVAGETDMIAVKPNGNILILDFKTTNKSNYEGFFTYIEKSGKLRNWFRKDLRSILGKQQLAPTSLAYRKQLTMYSIMLDQSVGLTTDGLEIIPGAIKYKGEPSNVLITEYDSYRKKMDKSKIGQSLKDRKEGYKWIINKKGEKVILRAPHRIILKRDLDILDGIFSYDKNDIIKQIKDYVSNLKFVKVADFDLTKVDSELSNRLTSELLDLEQHITSLLLELEQLDQIDDVRYKVDEINQYYGTYQTIIQNINFAIQDAVNGGIIPPSGTLSVEQMRKQLLLNNWNLNFDVLKNITDAVTELKNQTGVALIDQDLYELLCLVIANLDALLNEDFDLDVDTKNNYVNLRQHITSEFKIKETKPIIPNIEDSYPKPTLSKFISGTGKSNKAGIAQSVSTDGTTKLTSVILDPNFTKEALFELCLISPTDTTIHVRITYKGKTYTPVAINYSESNTGPAFKQSVLEKLRKSKTGTIVVPNAPIIRTSKGIVYKFKPGTNLKEYTSLVNSGLVTLDPSKPGINIYDIDLYGLAQNGNIGIIYYSQDQSGIVTMQVRNPRRSNALEVELLKSAGVKKDAEGNVTGQRYQNRDEFGIRDGLVQYQYDGQYDHTKKPQLPQGTFVLLYPDEFNENPNTRTPIALNREKLTQGDAQFIIDALTGKYGNTQSDTCIVDGEPCPVRILDMVDLLIPHSHMYKYSLENRSDGDPDIPHMELDGLDEFGRYHTVRIVGRVEGDPIDVLPREFLLDSKSGPNGTDAFIQFVTNRLQKHIGIRGFATNRFSPENMSGRTSSDQFSGFNNLFKNVNGTAWFENSKHTTLRFGDSSLRFDIDDFYHTDDQGNPKPITGMGWYIKNGFLSVSYAGRYIPMFTFDEKQGCTITLDGVKPSVLNETQTNAQYNPNSDLSGDGLDKLTTSEKPNKPINEEKAIKNLERILGKNGFVMKFKEDYIAMFKSGKKSVGRCYADAIELSMFAEEGTEYHEAFHRVLELLVSEKERARIYKKYRTVHNLSEDVTDRLVTEMLADDFMEYANSGLKIKWIVSNLNVVFSDIKQWVSVFKRIGSLYRLYNIYKEVNKGKYANIKPSKEALDKFAKFAKNSDGKSYLDATIHNVSYDHIHHESVYNQLIDYFCWALTRSTDVAYTVKVNEAGVEKEVVRYKEVPIDVTGKNINQLDLSERRVKSDRFRLLYINPILEENDAMKDAVMEMIDHWDLVQQDVAIRLKKNNGINAELRLDDVEDTQYGNGTSKEKESHAGIIDYSESIEVSQFRRTSERVKFFFSNIEKRISDIKGEWKTLLNANGLPSMWSTTNAFYTVLNRVNNCTNLQELIDRLNELRKDGPLFAEVSDRLNAVYKKYIDSIASGKIDADTEAFLSLLMTSIRCATLSYKQVRSFKNPDGSRYLEIVDPDRLYKTDQYIEDWGEQLESGSSKLFEMNEHGKYVIRKGFSVKHFSGLAQRIKIITQCCLQEQSITFKEGTFDTSNDAGIYKCRVEFCKSLTMLGIYFTVDDLDEYLYKNYKSAGKVAFKQFLQDNYNNIINFASKINAINIGGNATTDGKFAIDEDGKINGLSVSEYFCGSKRNNNIDPFVRVLAQAAIQYERVHEQMSIRAAGGSTIFTKSENNHITDTAERLTRCDSEIQKMKQVSYNMSSDGKSGSIFCKKAGKVEFRFEMHNGFSSDENPLDDNDYLNISKREDWVAKASILSKGYFILPTLSDKKTYGWFDLGEGVMPSIKTSDITLEFLNQASRGGRPISEEILEQIDEYLNREREAISLAIDDRESNPDQMIENADGGTSYNIYNGYIVEDLEINPVTGEKFTDAERDNVQLIKVYQLGRFRSMLGCYSPDGTWVDFNTTMTLDNKGRKLYRTEKQCLDAADAAFFLQSKEHRYEQIRLSLSTQIDKELNNLVEMGLIQKNEDLYSNIGLDCNKIKLYENALNAIDNSDPVRNHHIAVILYVSDVACKHIISMEEFVRVFSGRHAFYKWVYDNNGKLIDTTTDWSKRLGGLVSTGANNNMSIDGFNDDSEYVCAETEDELVMPLTIEEIKIAMYDSELRSGLLRIISQGFAILRFKDMSEDEIADEIDSMNINEVEDILKTYNLNLFNTLVKTANSKVEAFTGKKQLGDVNVADGASYISDTMCENLLRMVGSYSTEIQEAFKILRGEKTSTILLKKEAYNKVLTTVIGSLKYSGYGFRYKNGHAIPYYNKTALFPVFKCISYGAMSAVYSKMKQQGIDMLMMHSAVKVGSLGAKDTDWSKISDPNFKYNTYTQPYRNIRKLFNTDPKEAELMAVGTQMTKIVMLTIINGRKYTSGRRGRNIRNSVMSNINALSEIGKRVVQEEYFDESGNLDMRKLSNTLVKELTGRGASYDLIEAVKYNESTNDLNVPFSALSSMSWIQSIIVSGINKKIIDINLPGHPFYQRSVWGMEGLTLMSENDYPEPINNGNPLKITNDDNSMDCVLSIDYFDHIFEKTGLKYASFEKKKQWLIDNGIIGNTAKANMIGYRIPTQAISSIHALRCVDVIPVVRDTVILPKEFTTITGSDFDIDKLFISIKHYNITSSKSTIKDKNGKDKEINIYSASDAFNIEDEEEYYGNNLMDDYLELLKDQKGYCLLNGSIDKDTEFLKELCKEIYPSTKHPMQSFDDVTLYKQVDTKDGFVTGKTGIGPFALNNNSHILTMLYNVGFNKDSLAYIDEVTLSKDNKNQKDIIWYEKNGYSVTQEMVNAYNNGESVTISKRIPSLIELLGMDRLDRAIDDDGTSIMSHLSGLINAHVDIAKDPYVTKLNVNGYTYNLVNLLVRTGMGKKGFYFLNQPVLRLLAITYSTANGVYMRPKGLSKTEAQQQAEKDAINAIASVYGYKNIEEFEKKFKDSHGISIDHAISELFRSKDILKNCAKNYNLDDLKRRNDDIVGTFSDGTNITFGDVQLLSILAKHKLDYPAKLLADVVKYSKIDTKKQGKNLLEQEIYIDEYRKIKDNRVFINLDNMMKDSYVDTKTNNAIGMFTKIMHPITIECSKSEIREDDMSYSILRFIMSKIGLGDKMNNVEARNTIIKHLYGLYRNMWFFGHNGFCQRYGIDIEGLVTGKDCIYNRLLRIKAHIRNNKEYENMRTAEGDPSNYLLANLVSGYKNDVVSGKYFGAKFVTFNKQIEGEELDGPSITQAWEELLNDSEHPELQLFARDLIAYAYLTSAEIGGKRDLCKFIPLYFKNDTTWSENNIDGIPEELQAKTFAEYMKSIQAAFMNNDMSVWNPEVFAESIILANYTNDQFVRTIDTDVYNNWTIRSNHNFNGYPYIVVPGIIKTSNSGEDKYVPFWKNNTPEYFKISTGIKGNDKIIYKNIGTIYNNGVLYPVYSIVQQNSFKFKAGYAIYDYRPSSSYQMTHEFRKTIESLIRYYVDPEFKQSLVQQLTDMLIGDTTVSEDKATETDDKKHNNGLNERKASDKEEILTIQSDKTILSNEELAVWNKDGVGDKPRILVASERTDPAFHVKDILDILSGKKNVDQMGIVNGRRAKVGEVSGKDFAGLYLITKHDGLPMKQLLETKIPKLIHFSITGLGSTKYEPGVMKPSDLLDRIGEYIEQGLDPESVTIRIDPIVPGVTTPNMIEEIVKRASEMGIKRIRFSIMDAYPSTVASMTKLGYDFNDAYGINPRTGNFNFTAKKDRIDAIVNFMLLMKDKYGITLGTCAEGLSRDGISKEGCLSVDSVNRMLGTYIEDKGTDNNDQRKLCSCYGGKIDALEYGKHCASHCVYCYAKHDSDTAMLYYNEDGTLKDNVFTRTIKSSKNEKVVTDALHISDKTATNGVIIDTRLKNYNDENTKRIAREWLNNNPNGIVAFRLSKDYNTAEMAKAGVIGNPFNWLKYGNGKAVQMFYDWLTTGNNFGEELATEEYRQAIIDKLNSIDTPNILYYKELGYPSHATVLGYLINNKDILNNTEQVTDESFEGPIYDVLEQEDLGDFSEEYKNYCKGI